MFCPPSLTAGLQNGGAPGMRPTAAQKLRVLASEMGLRIPVSSLRIPKAPSLLPLSLALSQAVPPPLQESFIFAAIGKARSAHAQVLHQPQVLHLVPDQHFIKAAWGRGNRVVSRLSPTDGPSPLQGRPSPHGPTGWEGPTGLFGIIGLDAADIGGLLGLEDLHQLQEAHLELGGNLASQGERKVGQAADPRSCPSLGQGC